jgi:hypothetical protein
MFILELGAVVNSLFFNSSSATRSGRTKRRKNEIIRLRQKTHTQDKSGTLTVAVPNTDHN